MARVVSQVPVFKDMVPQQLTQPVLVGVVGSSESVHPGLEHASSWSRRVSG